jgi:ribosomal-protein-alanine N-acetyltransferase
MKSIKLKILDINDYDSWKKSLDNQLDPQNKWDRSHRKEETSKTAFKKLLKAQATARQLEKNYTYAIFFKGEFCGYVMAMDIVRGITHSAYLGYTLHNQFWGKGIAVVAIEKFFKIAFKDLGLHRLQAGIEPKNKRSLVVAKKLKMRKEGLSKNIINLRGEWQDLVQFAITSEEVGIKWKGTSNKLY